MLHKILSFSTFRPPKEKNPDLYVTEDFKIFNFLDPQSENNADLDVSEDFTIFNLSGPKN